MYLDLSTMHYAVSVIQKNPTHFLLSTKTMTISLMYDFNLIWHKKKLDWKEAYNKWVHIANFRKVLTMWLANNLQKSTYAVLIWLSRSWDPFYEKLIMLETVFNFKNEYSQNPAKFHWTVLLLRCYLGLCPRQV